MFCEKCGRNLNDDDVICPLCHNTVKQSKQEAVYADDIKFKKYNNPTSYPDDEDLGEKGIKSRLTAGFLQVFLGALGIGRFYLGYTAIGILQIVVGLFTCGMGGFIWGIIDGVLILNGTVDKDARGRTLLD